MARKKKAPEHENHERWLVSYADFITLLFAFFVVMFASSQTDKGKAQQVSNSVKAALDEGGFTTLVASVLGGTVGDTGQGNAQMKGPGGAESTHHSGDKSGLGEGSGGTLVELKPALDFLSRELSEEIAAGQMQVNLQPRGLVVSFREAAFFPSGEATVSEKHIVAMEKVAEVIRQLPNPVRMEGHSDSIPIHTPRFRSNWELSAARSIAMLNLFAAQFSVPKERMSIAAYGENAPVAPNETPAGRARNRRVDIILLSEIGKQGEPLQEQPDPAHREKAFESHPPPAHP
jgi:chemotaxis protein MotB